MTLIQLRNTCWICCAVLFMVFVYWIFEVQKVYLPDHPMAPEGMVWYWRAAGVLCFVSLHIGDNVRFNNMAPMQKKLDLISNAICSFFFGGVLWPFGIGIFLATYKRHWFEKDVSNE